MIDPDHELLDVLKEVKQYIKEKEVSYDGEWGSVRDFEQLLRDKCVPDLYDKVLMLIEASEKCKR